MPCFPSWMLQSITHLYLTASVLMDASTLSCILFPSSIEPPSPSPPLRAPLLLSVIIISISLTISLSPSVPSYEIKHESIIHSFKHIYHRRVCCTVPCLSAKLFFFLLLCFSYSPLVRSHLKTPQRLGVFFSGASTDKSGSWGSKNPFRGFSCHNNSSASLK